MTQRPGPALIWMAATALSALGGKAHAQPPRPAAAPSETDPARLADAGRFREALERLGPAPAPATQALRGRIELGLGKYAEAEATLAAPGPGADEPARLAGLARAIEARGDLDRAISTMQQAVDARRALVRAPDSLDGAAALAEARTELGALAFRAGRLDLARDQFQQAISLVGAAHARMHAQDIPHDERDPRLLAGGATAGLARAYAALGDHPRAERSWRGIMARTDDPAILLALAAYSGSRGDAKSARRHLDRAVKLSEGEPAHRRTRALILADQPETRDEALRVAESAFADGPDIAARDALAWVLHRRGDDARAGELIRPALDLGTRDPAVLYHAGRIAQASGRPDDARKLLSAAVAVHPAFDPIDGPEARRILDQLR